MSYYDSSSLTKRIQNKVIANGFISRMNSNNLTYGPQLGISSDSIINNVKQGQMKDINKCNGSFNVDSGCPCINNNGAFNGIINNPEYTLNLFNNISTGTAGGNFTKLIEVNGNIIGILNTPRFSSQTPAPVGVTLNLLNPITNNYSSSPLLSVGSNTSSGYGIIASFKKDGTLNWITKIDTPNSASNINVVLNNIVYDITGIYVSGYSGISGTPPIQSQQVNFYNGVVTDLTALSVPDSTLIMSNNRFQSFIVKYSFDGKVLWRTKMETSTSGNSSLIITAGNGVLYFYNYVQGITSINIFNSSDISSSTITSSSSRFMPIGVFSQIGDLISVSKIEITGTSGSHSLVNINVVNDELYLSFRTYNQTLTIYKTNPTTPLDSPTVVITLIDLNNTPPLPNTNGISFVLLSLKLNSFVLIDSIAIPPSFILKSTSTIDNLNNCNVTSVVFKEFIILGGWFQGTIVSIGGNNYTAAPGINSFIFVLTPFFTITQFIKPYGSDSRIYDMYVSDIELIYAVGLSNGTVTFPSVDYSNVNFTALGGNDAIIFCYDFDGNFKWITNWQSTSFENALCITKYDNRLFVGGYIDQLTNFYVPNLVTRLPNSDPDLTYTATARSPSLVSFTLPV
jgi:hypothetical protein